MLELAAVLVALHQLTDATNIMQEAERILAQHSCAELRVVGGGQQAHQCWTVMARLLEHVHCRRCHTPAQRVFFFNLKLFQPCITAFPLETTTLCVAVELRSSCFAPVK